MRYPTSPFTILEPRKIRGSTNFKSLKNVARRILKLQKWGKGSPGTFTATYYFSQGKHCTTIYVQLQLVRRSLSFSRRTKFISLNPILFDRLLRMSIRLKKLDYQMFQNINGGNQKLSF